MGDPHAPDGSNRRRPGSARQAPPGRPADERGWHHGARLDNGPVSNSYVVTGGGRGVGRAIVERLAGACGTVVIIEMDQTVVDWVPDYLWKSRHGYVRLL